MAVRTGTDTTTGTRSRARRAGQVSLAVVAVAASIVAWTLSARLAGTGVSIGYLVSARSFAAGDGLLSPTGDPYTLYGPAYPVALAWVSELGVSLLTAARLLSAASLGATAILAGLWVRRLCGSWWSAPVGGAAAVLFAPALTTRAVWSEPLFMAVTLGGGLCLAVAVQRRAPVALAAGGALLGLGVATRYAGLVLLLVAVYVVIVWPGSWRVRAGAAAAFLAPAAVVTGVMVGRNLALAPDEPLGERVGSTMSPSEVGEDTLRGVADLVSPPGLPFVLELAVLVAGTAGLLWLALSLRGRRPRVWWRDVLLPFLLAGLYLAGNVYAALTTKLDPMADGRLLVPCAPFLAVGAVSVTWAAVRPWATSPRRPTSAASEASAQRLARLRVALVVGPPAVLLVAALATTVRYGITLQPRERIGPEIVTSPVLNAIAEVGPARLVSDDASNAAWVSNRPVLPSPMYRGDPPAAPLPGDMHDFTHMSAHGPAVLIWTGAGDAGQVPLDVLGELCDLDLRSEHADGEIYHVRSCEAGETTQ
jgi:hypothetical protein